jgi:hypothetical protein
VGVGLDDDERDFYYDDQMFSCIFPNTLTLIIIKKHQYYQNEYLCVAGSNIVRQWFAHGRQTQRAVPLV